MIDRSIQYLTTGKLTRIFPQYLLSAVAATLLISINYVADTICIGQKLGEIGLAALNVVVPVTGFLYALGYLFAYGGSIQYASFLGKGDRDNARQAFTGSLLTMLVLVVLLMSLGLIFLDPITVFLSGGSSIAAASRDYLKFVFWFAPFYCLEIFFSVFTRNDDMPRLSMLGTLSGCMTNIVLDLLFIFVLEWDMIGASLATGLALIVASFVEMSGMLRPSSNLRFMRIASYPRKLWSCIRVGAPTFVRELSASLVILIINIILLRLSGETAVAAYGVIANLGTIVCCGLAGVSNAMQPLVSVNAGAERSDRVQKLLRMALIWSAALSLLYLILAELWPQLLTAVFVDSKDPSFLSMSIQGIRLVSPSYVLAGLIIVLNVYFESVQANGRAFVLSVARGAVIPVITVLIFAGIWGIAGVWLSFLAAEFISFVLALVMTRSLNKNIDRQLRFNQSGAHKEGEGEDGL